MLRVTGKEIEAAFPDNPDQSKLKRKRRKNYTPLETLLQPRS